MNLRGVEVGELHGFLAALGDRYDGFEEFLEVFQQLFGFDAG